MTDTIKITVQQDSRYTETNTKTDINKIKKGINITDDKAIKPINNFVLIQTARYTDKTTKTSIFADTKDTKLYSQMTV